MVNKALLTMIFRTYYGFSCSPIFEFRDIFEIILWPQFLRYNTVLLGMYEGDIEETLSKI
jgi:hypothetical protein